MIELHPHGDFECLVCPRRPDGTNVTHLPLIATRSPKVRKHHRLTAILLAGVLEEQWPALTKRDRLLILRRVEADTSQSLPDIEAMIESDGFVRSFAVEYQMTRHPDAQREETR